MSRRTVTSQVHRTAGILAFVIILTFWISTVSAELLGSTDAVIAVKQTIPWGLLVLVPALAVTGATGFGMAGKSRSPLIAGKKRRMPVIAGIGLLILVPSALFLARAASDPNFGGAFYAVQAVELIAGATNLTLMTLNIRDGLHLTGRLKARTA